MATDRTRLTEGEKRNDADTASNTPPQKRGLRFFVEEYNKPTGKVAIRLRAYYDENIIFTTIKTAPPERITSLRASVRRELRRLADVFLLARREGFYSGVGKCVPYGFEGDWLEIRRSRLNIVVWSKLVESNA